MSELRFDAIGTAWTIELPDTVPEEELGRLADRIRDRIETFDLNYSRFRNDSLVAQMSREAGTYHLPEDAKPMLDLYRELYDATDGSFTPLIGKTLADAGYDAKYSFIERDVVTPPAWSEALSYSWPMLTLERPALLDFGAAGKGYLVDIIAELLETEGVVDYIVDAGGDMRISNTEPVEIALEDPADTSQAIGVASLTKGSLCGSSGNRRAWGKYHHTIDPQTLESPRQFLAVWTVADTALVADAMATALNFAPPERLTVIRPFEYLMIRPDRSLVSSADFPATVFLSS